MTGGQKLREIRGHVSRLVETLFGGSYLAAIEYYEPSCGGLIGWVGLTTLLAEAGADTRRCRSAWAAQLIVELGRGGWLSWSDLPSGLVRIFGEDVAPTVVVGRVRPTPVVAGCVFCGRAFLHAADEPSVQCGESGPVGRASPTPVDHPACPTEGRIDVPNAGGL